MKKKPTDMYQYHFLWKQSYKASSVLEICPVLHLLPHLPSEECKVTTYHAILLIIAQYSLDCSGAFSGTNNRISKNFLPKLYSRAKLYFCIPKEDALVKPPEKGAPLSCTARSGVSHRRGERQQTLRRAPRLHLVSGTSGAHAGLQK